MNFEDVTKIYNNSQAAMERGVETIIEHFAPAAAFSRSLAKLAAAAKSCEAGPECEDYLGLLRHIHRMFVCSPVPLSILLDLHRERLNELNLQLKPSLARLPEVRQCYEALIVEAKQLLNGAGHPLARTVGAWADSASGSVLVVVPSRRLVEPTRLSLGDVAANWEIYDPSSARNMAPVECLVLFGSPEFLVRAGHGHIVRAPLGSRIFAFCFGHFPVKGVVPSLLGAGTPYPSKPSEPPSPSISPGLSISQLELVLPARLDWSVIIRGTHPSEINDDHQLLAESKAVLLGGGKLAFLDVESKRWKLTTDHISGRPICVALESIQTESLSAGDLIVLTTEGSGDMLEPYAAQILGKNAATIHGLQTGWKYRLKELVERIGTSAVVAQLRARESPSANIPNVRNWCSFTNIAPSNLEQDLGAILALLGLESTREAVFDAVHKMRGARLSAGMHLQRSLLKQLQGKDLAEAFSAGHQEFQLQEGGPVKTVFFVEDIKEHTVFVPIHRLNRVQDVEEAVH
jgi:hypothetical protein